MKQLIGRKQAVELRTVKLELRLKVVDIAKHPLDLGDGRTDADLPAQLALEVSAGRQVVGMGVGLQQPLHLQAFSLDESGDSVGTGGADAPGGGIVVQHRVDDGAFLGARGMHHVAHGRRRRVEETLNFGVHEGPRGCQ